MARELNELTRNRKRSAASRRRIEGGGGGLQGSDCLEPRWTECGHSSSNGRSSTIDL